MFRLLHICGVCVGQWGGNYNFEPTFSIDYLSPKIFVWSTSQYSDFGYYTLQAATQQ